MMRAMGDCPPTSFPRGAARRDPCEITYKVDLPILGEEDVKLPINQVVNDVWLQLEPKVNALVADVEGEIMREAPDVAREVMDQIVIPRMHDQVEGAIAEIEVIRDDTVKALLIATGTTIAAIAFAAWWIKAG